jgi:hypothetical protein
MREYLLTSERVYQVLQPGPLVVVFIHREHGNLFPVEDRLTLEVGKEPAVFLTVVDAVLLG